MSKLTELLVPTSIVKTSGGELAVRGLSFDDISEIVNDHRVELEAIFGGGKAVKMTEVEGVLALVEKIPEVAAKVLATGANDPTPAGIEAARSLPFGLQVAVISEVAKLTFHDGGGPKNVLGTILNTLGMDSLPKAPNPSTT